MSPGKRQDRFFSGDASREKKPGDPPVPESGGEPFEIVDSEGRAPDDQPQPHARTGSSIPQHSANPEVSAPPAEDREPVPYIEDPVPVRRSSLGWAWLTIVVTLLLAVGSYWFYEGFDGDMDKVRERFDAFSNRLSPPARLTPLPETPTPQARPTIETGGIDPDAPLPVVTDAGEIDENPSEAPASESPTPAPEMSTAQGIPLTGTGTQTPVPSGVALDGTVNGGRVAASSAPGSDLPTRRRTGPPTRREPPGEQESAWYRTRPTLSMENAGTAAQSDVPGTVPGTQQTPRPLIRATPVPQMTPFAAALLDEESPTRREPPAETDSPEANRGAESEAGPPSVVLPTELTELKPTPTPTPTPKPTPVPPSQQGMTQMSVGPVTAGSSLVDLGLVYASGALAKIQRKFVPPFTKRGATCTVSFLIRKDGETYGATVEKSSGSDGLDNSAVKAVTGASPLPPLEPTIGEEAVRVEVTFEF